MRLRARMIVVLALLFAAMIVMVVGVQARIMMPSFAEMERDDAATAMRRIDFALGLALDGLEVTAADWGNWVDVYRFVQTPDARFIEANLTLTALKQLGVNMLMIVAVDGTVVAASSRSLEDGAPLPLDLTAAAKLPDTFAWRRGLDASTPARGLLRTNLGIMLLAAAPIRDGSGAGASRGRVIVGRLLDERELRSIRAEAQAAFAVTPGRRDAVTETDALTQMFKSYTDLDGHALMSLRVDQPRKISARGRQAVKYASALLLVGGVGALLLLLLLLNRVVLEPLARVTQHAVRIGQDADLTTRLDLPGHDEIALLAREFDRMVKRVADSRRQLMDRSFQAGFAELAKGVLHNLGNAMTPLSVRLCKLGERLSAAPAGDLELAIGELTAETGADARATDLREFSRLAARELGAAIADAQADVLVIQRQAAIVQTALVELMRSTHNEHVVEPVRLPELVSQTLEIVPDACRQRLRVEADESLHAVGVVPVARTVLRLVLQNLIINAADAVRDAGRDRGVLKVAADIVQDAQRRQLHLRCVDDGIGIDSGSLDRVFEQGYSTKSRTTNHGIGLHWCANAVASLGGKIWAVSDGPGRGAALHLLLPLPLRTTPTVS